MRNPLHPALNFITASNLSPSKLIKVYCEKGLLDEARQLFDSVPKKDVVTWTAMISGYTSHANIYDAWEVFQEMQRDGTRPNAFTISNILKACKTMGSLFLGASVHGLATKHGSDGYMYVENALVDMYATCGDGMGDAFMVFERIQEKTSVSWTTMIAGYTRSGEAYKGIQAFRWMLLDGVQLSPFSCSIAIRASASVGRLIFGKQIHAALIISGLDSNLPVGNSLVDMYCRCMSLSDAEQCFNEMSQRDLITWNTMIAGLEKFGSHGSLKLFSQMSLYDLKPNCFTFTSIAAASANLAVLNCGQQVHGGIIRRGYVGTLALSNALIDMYAKCGCINDSRRIFDEMPQKDLVSWTSMMIGYGNHGYGREAIELFERMVALGFQPDHVGFMGILSACGHSGLVDEGLDYFKSMDSQYHVCPDQEIYGCVVDLLGRVGRLVEAHELIKTMPFEADETVWGALLGACKVHRNTDLGRLAAQKILDLRPERAETYIILSNIYAADGKWGEFAETRKTMKGMGTRKEAGRSWIEVRDHVHSFVVGERISPHMEMIYEELEVLGAHMIEEGYVSDCSCLLHCLEDGI